MLLQRISYIVALAVILSSCSTKKNTVVSRAYHNLTARYNGYYYSNENIDEGIYKVEKAHKENYDKVLPVYIYPTKDKKTATAEFDKAIKKSSLCIQKHAIKDKKGNEIPTAGKWIDNNWINIGIAHFYKREIFSAIESFEYVARTYNKSPDKFSAILWLAKANNEIGSITTSDTYLGLLKNERNLPRKVRKELPVAWADYYMRRGQNTEAIAKLMEATRNKHWLRGIRKKDRARYTFIIGQLAELQKDNNRAIHYYSRTIRLKPQYEMVFYSKIKIARLLDVKRTNSSKTKKDLLKMTREFKNTDYYDVIFFTLGEIEEREKNLTQAQTYYKRSVQTSVNNPNQKALSFLKLAEINFGLTRYQAAEAYYDSTIATLPVDHPDYNNIIARKKTLETLVTQIKTIDREDSLQKIARMSEKQRNNFIDKMIRDIEREEERKQQEIEAAMNASSLGTNTLVSNDPMQQQQGGLGQNTATFYFYNPTAVAFGVADFVKRWGNRKNEDNWRRSNKAMVLEDEKLTAQDSLSAKNDTVKKITLAKKDRDYYLKGLPLTDSLISKSNTRIIHAYYLMGSVYKEELNNTKKTISTFEELNKRFPDNKYTLNTYYSLYRIYLEEKNNPKAEFYKNKILTDYPNSEFAALIKNPEYAQQLNAKKDEVEEFYTEAYGLYKKSDYSGAYSKSKEGIRKYGKNDYLPKFEFIKSMSLGKLRGIDTLEQSLKVLVAKYPNADVTPLAQDVLQAIKKQKNPIIVAPVVEKEKKDTFNLDFNVMHYVIAIGPDNTKAIDAFKSNIGVFNNVFFSEKKFEMTSSLFGTKQIVLIKSFPNAKDAMAYYENLVADPDVFKGDVKKEEFEILPISADNLPFLYRTKNFAGYKLFYGDTYQRANTRN